MQLAAGAGTEGDWTFRRHRKLLQEHPALSLEEELARAVRMRRGDEQAREQLLLSNLRMILRAAGWYRHTGVDPDDLIQAGWEVLLRKLDTFDPKKGVRLFSYAQWAVKGAMDSVVGELAYAVRLPEERAGRLASSTRGSDPRAAISGDPDGQVYRLRRAADERVLGPHGQAADDPEERVLHRLEQMALAKALARATHWFEEREKEVLYIRDKEGDHHDGYASNRTITVDWMWVPQGAVWSLRFGKGDGEACIQPIPGVQTTRLHFSVFEGTLESLAERWGVTKARIHQVRESVLEALRSGPEGYWLAPFRPVHAGPFRGPEVFLWETWLENYIVADKLRDKIAALEMGRDIVVYARTPAPDPAEAARQIADGERYLRHHRVLDASRQLPCEHAPSQGVFLDIGSDMFSAPHKRPAFKALLAFCEAHPHEGDTPGFVVVRSPKLLRWFRDRLRQSFIEDEFAQWGWQMLYLHPFETAAYGSTPWSPYGHA